MMPEITRTALETAFHPMTNGGEVDLITIDKDLHIAGDVWTLVLEGDPVSSVLVALDDEDGEPNSVLQAALGEKGLSAFRDLDAHSEGHLSTLLAESPDPVANALAALLKQE